MIYVVVVLFVNCFMVCLLLALLIYVVVWSVCVNLMLQSFTLLLRPPLLMVCFRCIMLYDQGQSCLNPSPLGDFFP